MFVHEAAHILSNDDKDFLECLAILEDGESPITQKLTQQLYEDIVAKGHIDFGDIAKSAGDITKYSGYTTMLNTLNTLTELGTAQKSQSVVKYAELIKKVMLYFAANKAVYVKGFATKTDFVMIEYNTYVFTCVEATSTLLYEFVDFIKSPEATNFEIVLKNDKYRANLFYFDQLELFFNMVSKGKDHVKMLDSVIINGRNNFVGSSVVLGWAVIIGAVLSIIPITRRLIYVVYKLRGNVSESLKLQANFLEMNKLCVEANSALSPERKRSILEKQKKQAQILTKISDTLRVKDSKATLDAKRELGQSNRNINTDSVRKDIEDSPLELV